MTSDDYEVVAFKVLSYLYACMKAGKRVDVAAMHRLAGVNEAYFGMVVRGLQDRGLVSGFAFDGLSGCVIDSPNLATMRDPSVTMDGAVYVRENSRMAKVRGFLGHALDVALGAAVSAATSLI